MQIGQLAGCIFGGHLTRLTGAGSARRPAVAGSAVVQVFSPFVRFPMHSKKSNETISWHSWTGHKRGTKDRFGNCADLADRLDWHLAKLFGEWRTLLAEITAAQCHPGNSSARTMRLSRLRRLLGRCFFNPTGRLINGSLIGQNSLSQLNAVKCRQSSNSTVLLLFERLITVDY